VQGHDLHVGDWRRIDVHYPLINHSNQRPVHFLQGYADFLAEQLDVRIPITEFRADVHLRDEEKAWLNQVHERFGYAGRFWIMMAGGKHDFTAKWWPPEYYQRVVDHFMGRIQFVQCGQNGHWHPPLRGTFSLVGQTSVRQFVRLTYHADGVVCPVTFAMHLAAAVPTRTARLRPCVVIAGGREPPHWEAYPGHQFLHTMGCLPCCATGGCWRSRCQPVGDGDRKDYENMCERPVQVTPDLRVPQCMVMVRPTDVIAAIERALGFLE
jgi:ADP-heptose:LPS heptosyltransferase